MKTGHRLGVKKDTSAKEKPQGVLHAKLDRTLKNQAPLIALIVLPDTLLKAKQQRLANPARADGYVVRENQVDRIAPNAKLDRIHSKLGRRLVLIARQVLSLLQKPARNAVIALLVGCVERQIMERSAFNAKLER